MSGNFEVLPCGTQARLAQVEAERDALRALIADDAFASSFQTMAQYRSALLKATKGGGNG